MRSFKEKEKTCEELFANGSPFWHAYTSGKDTPTIFTNEVDMKLVMNLIAQTAAMFSEMKILAFQVMNNHLHFIISAKSEYIISAWKYLRKRIGRNFSVAKHKHLFLNKIPDLSALRHAIVYVNRNGYVTNPSYTPFSYPWGTSRYYFSEFVEEGRALSDIFYDDRRAMFKCRTPSLPNDWKVTDNFVSPGNYCDIKLGMALFRDAHHYFSQVSKNIEAYTGIAAEIDDGEFLTDTEIFSQVISIIKERYNQTSLKDVTKAQKTDLARMLHHNYRSSNGQISRTLGLTQYEVDNLFPLRMKNKSSSAK